MKGLPALCGVCRREIPLRGDGRLRAHLAAGSAAGNRQQCDGSGGYSARVELLDGADPHQRETAVMSRAEAFNAREAWYAVSALYDDWKSMEAGRAASWRAVAEAKAAYRRAYDDAMALAEWWDVEPHQGEDGAA